jgi:predicted nucleotidyltransferase
MLSYRLETQIYRFLAKVVAKRLYKFDAVLGVYGKRSLASGEIVFGRSDIDLTILIADFDREKEEASFLCHLCDTYSRTKKLLPMLGECNIFNGFDIRAWYLLNTYESFTDRNWIRLYGEDINPFRVKMNKEDVIFKFIWWTLFLFVSYRKRTIKGCFNVLMELANGYYTYIGAFDEPKLKREHVLGHLIAADPSCEELRRLQRAFYSGFPGKNYGHLNKWIYQECLSLCDKLYDHVPKKLEGEVRYSQISSSSPPEFFPVTYIIIKSATGEEIEDGLEAMERDQQAVLITDKWLNLYLYYYNPWEYYTMMRTNGPFGLPEPPAEAMRECVLKQANKVVPRYIGLTNTKYDMLYNLISQCRLYLDHGFISQGEDELREAYKLHYGVWPYREHSSRSSYFAQDYPVLLRVIDDIYKGEIFARALRERESYG